MPLTDFSHNLTFEHVEFPEVKESVVGRAAKRENLSVKDTQNTNWYMMMLDGEQVGLIALIKVRGTLYRLKAAFVLPEWRRQGFYSVAAAHIMREAKREGGTEIMAFVRPDSAAALKNLGWVDAEQYKNPAVEYDLSGFDPNEDLHEITERLCGS